MLYTETAAIAQGAASTDALRTIGQIASIASAAAAVLTALFTRTLPWIRAKYVSHSVTKRIGAELFPVPVIERAIRYYIPPDCQDVDPAGVEEPRFTESERKSLFKTLDRALKHPTDYRYLILLADSGMGKTSALINYYVRHLRRVYSKQKIALIPLGIPDADVRIASIEEKQQTILFLDALDEDTLAVTNYSERLRTLIETTRDFQRVVISCRTQFFPRDEEIPYRTAVLKVGARAAGERAEYLFHRIYLSPFSDQQVHRYLRKLYPFWRVTRYRRASTLVSKIPSLNVRPMLLAYVDDLVRSKREMNHTCEVYEAMIDAWLQREQGFVDDTQKLREFSERLAVDLVQNRLQRGAERIDAVSLTRFAREWNIPVEDWKLSGRSLLNRDAQGNLKFAHRSIMEYLYVKWFLSGSSEGRTVEWTDQMHEFLRDFIHHALRSGKHLWDVIPVTPGSDFTSAMIEMLKSIGVIDANQLQPFRHWVLAFCHWWLRSSWSGPFTLALVDIGLAGKPWNLAAEARKVVSDQSMTTCYHPSYSELIEKQLKAHIPGVLRIAEDTFTYRDELVWNSWYSGDRRIKLVVTRQKELSMRAYSIVAIFGRPLRNLSPTHDVAIAEALAMSLGIREIFWVMPPLIESRRSIAPEA
jgi:hypothetical protein